MYFLSVIDCIDLEPKCLGFFSTLKEIEQILLSDTKRKKIQDNYYTHAIIEEYEEGIPPKVLNEYWYAFYYKSGWERCEKPEKLSKITNIAIGA